VARAAKARRDPIPPLIKRNMAFFATAQACAGVATQLTPTMGALIAVRLSGTTALAGAATSMLGLSRLVIAYPIGAVTDRFGRKAGVLLGLLLGVLGAFTAGASVLAGSFPLFLLGAFVIGCGSGAVQQLRVAAADMFPPSRRAEGVGLLQTGSLIGTFGGTGLISLATALSPILKIDTPALAWFMAPAVFLPAAFLVALARPDPKVIAANLTRYYPNHVPTAQQRAFEEAGPQGVKAFLRDYPKFTAFVAYFMVQGNMSMMMAMSSVVLDHHGHELPAISLAVAFHVVGMFGFALPFGRMSDRLGRRQAMLLGVVLAGGGSLVVVATPDYWPITFGVFLVGLGWSAVGVAATALIADRCSPAERGRAIGANDTFGGAASIAMPLSGGPLAAVFGLPVVGVFGMAVMLVPLVLLLRLRETSPGHYE
jgi:MFS family permease